MKKIWLTLLLLVSFQSFAQIRQHNISDDGFAHIPLQFPFPLYGQVFTDSYMFSNGVVGFGSVQQGWCCSGVDLANQKGYQFNYSIMPLQTDLINYGSGRFLTEGTTTYQRYVWENISEYGIPGNLNTFGVEIRPDGFIGMYYEKVNLSPNRIVTSGVTGDTNLNEYRQFYHGPGFTTDTPYEYTLSSTGSLCLSNPLSSPLCPGYEVAYTNQQCAANPLYRPACPGYEQAYLEQQCSIDALYSTSCLGYETAYFNQQCSLNTLYNSGCPGYAEAYLAQQCALNSLYSTTCPNYAQAYFNEQCRLNPLYDRTCAGYSEAYALANIVPSASNTAVSTTVPSVQVSTTGTISLETPVVADPIVNEVVTSNSTISTSNNTIPKSTSSVSSATSPVTQSVTSNKKEDKKENSKQVENRSTANKSNDNLAAGAPTIAQPYEYKSPIILDPLFAKMVKTKPIKNNDWLTYRMLIQNDKLHEEMVDGQYRKDQRRQQEN
jgi:hypothetical protein